jgi:hypothetical protein
MSRIFPILFGLLILNTCQRDVMDQDTIALRSSFQRFVSGVQELDSATLNASVYFPGVGDYRSHVKTLLVRYLDELKTGTVTFDPQGVVLVRYLGLAHHKVVTKEVEFSQNRQEARMRLFLSVGYENNILHSQPEKGTVFYIPGHPWGSVHAITIGAVNPTPREHLRSLMFDVMFRSTNLENHWQVREIKPLLETMVFVKSEEDFL